jgi:hypothetical protein
MAEERWVKVCLFWQTNMHEITGDAMFLLQLIHPMLQLNEVEVRMTTTSKPHRSHPRRAMLLS